MQFIISRFEVKKLGDDRWQEVSEKIVMEKLADCFDPVTPTLAEMLAGREIATHQEKYRIRS